MSNAYTVNTLLSIFVTEPLVFFFYLNDVFIPKISRTVQIRCHFLGSKTSIIVDQSLQISNATIWNFFLNGQDVQNHCIDQFSCIFLEHFLCNVCKCSVTLKFQLDWVHYQIRPPTELEQSNQQVFCPLLNRIKVKKWEREIEYKKKKVMYSFHFSKKNDERSRKCSKRLFAEEK